MINSKILIKRSKNGGYFFLVYSANGRGVCKSPHYVNLSRCRQAARNVINMFKRTRFEVVIPVQIIKENRSRSPWKKEMRSFFVGEASGNVFNS